MLTYLGFILLSALPVGGCHAGLDAVVLSLDARGVFLLGWVRMPSARDASL